MAPVPRRAALAFALATLGFGRQIAAWSDPDNRYLYHWQRADGRYLIAAVLLTALLVLLLVEAVRRFGGARFRRLLPLMFALVLGQVLVGLVLAPNAEKPFEGAQLASFTMLGLTLWWWRRDPARVSRIAATVALLAVPLGPILFIQILSWRSWPLCGAPRAGPPAQPGARPVFVLLFDEWSQARSEGADGQFLPELVNLRHLAARSTVYTEARSPGDATLRSIPRLLFGENGEVVPGNGVAQWRVGDSTRPAADRPNLFRLAQERGYRTELVGWYLPYAALVGGDLDGCRVWTQVFKRSGYRRLLDLGWANLRHLPDPLSRAAWRALYARAFSENWYALERRIEEEAMRLASQAPANTVAFVHFPVPHAPFVFGAGGEYLGPFDEARMRGTVEDNARHLRFVDALVGRFIHVLESTGRLDSAVVVLTSDHSWKKDPDRRERSPERLRRVPLIVREPGRDRGEVVRAPTCLFELYDLLGRAVAESDMLRLPHPDCSTP